MTHRPDSILKDYLIEMFLTSVENVIVSLRKMMYNCRRILCKTENLN